MIKTVSLFMILSLFSANAFARHNGTDYEVTITNVTKAQIFAPTLVATHRSGIQIFNVGKPALPELATLAESGNPGPLQDLLDGLNRSVSDTNNSGGVLMPGESVTVQITAGSRYDRLSLVAMLVTTNDTFAGLNSVELPRYSSSFMIPAYDAGSELNDESCENIPGPPCGDMDDSGNTGEGFIYIGNGIQGIGDVDPAEYDWNNPVASVQIRRMR